MTKLAEAKTNTETLVQQQLIQEQQQGVVVVNSSDQLIYMNGSTDLYLQRVTGEVAAVRPEILELARSGLKNPMRQLLRDVKKSHTTTRTEGNLNSGGKQHLVQLLARPLSGSKGHVLITLEPVANSASNEYRKQSSSSGSTMRGENERELELEVVALRNQLTSSINKLESSNMELKTANEESMAMNEEYQTINEELEVSKEELQCLNEELTTLNEQLSVKLEELEEARSDLNNLLISTEMPTIFLGVALEIRWFTPSCKALIHFINADVGRSLSDITAEFAMAELLDDARAVLGDLRPRQREIETASRQVFIVRTLPYRSGDNYLGGVVLTFSDVTSLRASEKKTQRSLAELESIYSSTPVGLSYLDRELIFRNINQNLAEINGTAIAQTIGKRLEEVLPERLVTTVEPIYRQVIVSGEPISGVEVVGKTSGSKSERHFLVSLHPVSSNSGEILGVSSVVQDITEQRLSAIEMVRIQDRYEALIKASSSIVWSTNSAGDFITRQEAWELFTGQDWESHRGKGWVNALHPDDKDTILRLWQDAVENKSKFICAGRIWHKGSQGFRLFIVEAVPVIEEDDSIREWIGTISDVKEKELASRSLLEQEMEVRKQKRELELLYDTAPVGMSLVDRQLRYLRVNKTLAAINGIPLEAHIGKKGCELMPELSGNIDPLYEKVLESGQPLIDMEIKGRTPATDQERHWLISLHPLFDDDDIWAISAVVQDITDRKLLERALIAQGKQANQANISKSEFLANMSHEIRTPMTAILGYADILLAKAKDDNFTSAIQTIKRNGEHLLDIINDILDLSRIEAGKLEVHAKVLVLADFLDDIRLLVNIRAQAKALEFNIVADQALPVEVRTDQRMLKQILINLVGNAIKFTDTGYVHLTITLNCERGNGNQHTLVFAIKDTGIGISDSDRVAIFEPFSQGDTSVSREYGGSGLGLTISRRLTDMLGGTLSLESELGVGSTFRLEIPVGCLDEVGRAMLPQKIMTPELKKHPVFERIASHILLVDDRIDARAVAQHFLEDAGATVTVAIEGQEAIDAVKQAAKKGIQAFDMLLLDMQMPKLDGYTVASRLRSLGYDLPIIALTANAMQGTRQQCFNAGCDDYLSKPVSQAALVKTVRRWEQALSNGTVQRQRQYIADRADSTQGGAIDRDAICALVVDDNKDVALSTATLLSLDGIRSKIALCGEEALQIVAEEKPDCVLIDIGLPDINGNEVATQLRQKGYSGLLVAVSGRGEESDKQASLKAGFNHYLTKPIPAGELQALLFRTLAPVESGNIQNSSSLV